MNLITYAQQRTTSDCINALLCAANAAVYSDMSSPNIARRRNDSARGAGWRHAHE